MPAFDPERLRRLQAMTQAQLEGWRASGVAWLQRAEAILPDEVQTAMTPSDDLFAGMEPEPNTIPDEQRLIALDVLRVEVAKCTACPELVATRRQTVFGVGPLNAAICFVGEAPGADEDRTGEPFVGAAGQMLNRILAACGIDREEVYICNILRCRPPANRQPKPIECGNCRPFLEKTIELVNPQYLCALGAVAVQNLLGKSYSLTKARGKFHEFMGRPLICTYHPASLLEGRSPENKRLVWDDMKMLLAKMGRPIPEPKKKE